MGIFDWLFGNKKKLPKEKEEASEETWIRNPEEFDNIIESMIDFNQESHTFTDGTTVYKGDMSFSNFMESVESDARKVKLFSLDIKHEKSGNKINGKLYPDWEALKKFYVFLRENNLISDGTDLMMYMENTIACKWNFGKLDIDMLINLGRYYKEEIDEQEVDKLFGEFLLDKSYN